MPGALSSKRDVGLQFAAIKSELQKGTLTDPTFSPESRLDTANDLLKDLNRIIRLCGPGDTATLATAQSLAKMVQGNKAILEKQVGQPGLHDFTHKFVKGPNLTTLATVMGQAPPVLLRSDPSASKALASKMAQQLTAQMKQGDPTMQSRFMGSLGTNFKSALIQGDGPRPVGGYQPRPGRGERLRAPAPRPSRIW